MKQRREIMQTATDRLSVDNRDVKHQRGNDVRSQLFFLILVYHLVMFFFPASYSKLPPPQERPKKFTQNLTEFRFLNPFFGQFFFSWIFQYILSLGVVNPS